MNDTTPSKEKILSSKGLSLTIPPFQLRPGSHYHIIADLVDAASSSSIARSSISIFVRFHELKAFMVPVAISTGVNRAVNFDVKVFDRNVHRPSFIVSESLDQLHKELMILKKNIFHFRLNGVVFHYPTVNCVKTLIQVQRRDFQLIFRYREIIKLLQL